MEVFSLSLCNTCCHLKALTWEKMWSEFSLKGGVCCNWPVRVTCGVTVWWLWLQSTLKVLNSEAVLKILMQILYEAALPVWVVVGFALGWLGVLHSSRQEINFITLGQCRFHEKLILTPPRNTYAQTHAHKQTNAHTQHRHMHSHRRAHTHTHAHKQHTQVHAYTQNTHTHRGHSQLTVIWMQCGITGPMCTVWSRR